MSELRFLGFRLVQVVLTVVGIMTILFLMLHLSSDPAQVLAGPGATPDMIEATRVRIGLDQPLIVQYGVYLRGLTTADFGMSYTFQQPAMSSVMAALPASLAIVFPSLVISTVLGLAIGVAAATSRYPRLARGIMVASFVGQSIPFFWLGIVLILVFGLMLKLVPPVGTGGIEHIILPVAAMTISHLASLARLARGEVADILRRPFVTTARSKGLKRSVVIWRHVVPNALPPLVSWTSLTFAFSIGQLLIIEPLFAYNGLGDVVMRAVHTQDFPIVQAGVFVIAILVALGTVVADLINRTIDTSLKLKSQTA